jgi:hypothetical protein
LLTINEQLLDHRSANKRSTVSVGTHLQPLLDCQGLEYLLDTTLLMFQRYFQMELLHRHQSLQLWKHVEMYSTLPHSSWTTLIHR